jgi:hypothetical protein
MTRPLNLIPLLTDSSPWDDPFGRDGSDGGGTGGGGTGSPVSTANNVINDLQVDEGATKPLAYGRHIVAGQLILHDYSAGPPASSTVLVALGVGEWDSIEKLWYAGDEVPAASYHFHPGTQSTGVADPVQGIDSFFPTGLTYSETAYVAVQVPEPFVSEDRPDKLRGLYKCLKVADYDSNGNQIGYGYSANPARVAADLILKRAKRPASRIHWGSWVIFRNYCDELIPWDDGTTTRSIPRFECHIVFSQATDLATALESALGTAGAFWQDDGKQIRFLLPANGAVIHSFTESNIVEGSFAFYQRDIRERPNRLQAKFRNTDDPFLIETTVETKREALQEKVGVVDPGVRNFGSMTIAQAQRLLERQMRLEADYAIFAELRGQGDSLHVLPGDYVTVTHTVPLWTTVRCLVVDAVDESAEQYADERSFLLQRVDNQVYSDADQKPIQPAIAP